MKKERNFCCFSGLVTDNAQLLTPRYSNKRWLLLHTNIYEDCCTWEGGPKCSGCKFVIKWR